MKKLALALALLLALAIPMAAQGASPTPGNHHWRGASAMGGHWDGAGNGVTVTYQWTNPNAMNAYETTPAVRIHPYEACPPPAGCYMTDTSFTLLSLTCYANHTYYVVWHIQWYQYGYMNIHDDAWDSLGHIVNSLFYGPGWEAAENHFTGDTRRYPLHERFYDDYGQSSGTSTPYNGGCPA